MRVVVGGPLVGDALARVAAIAELVVTERATGFDRAELLGRVADADGIIALASQRIDDELLARAERLRVVANHAVGVDNVDLAACRARGIIVTNTPGVLTETTADLAFALILDACRRVSEGDRLVRAGAWTGWAPTHHLGMRVHGATLGIVGFGRIGQAVATRARAFAMNVLYASPRAVPSAPAAHVSLDELVARSDVISLHAPLSDATRGLFSRERLASMKRGAILVNTARGALLDETALAELLVSGHLGGAALDVYQGEPHIHEGLLSAPRLVLAPHIGSADVETRTAMADLACGAVVAVLSGETELANRVV